MEETLKVTISRTAKRKPFATVHNLPGLDAEMTPAQMRALGAALIVIASESENMSAAIDRRVIEFDLKDMTISRKAA